MTEYVSEYVWVELSPGHSRLVHKDKLNTRQENNAPLFHISPDYKGYDCPITGKWIDGRAEHRENLKRNNCRLLEQGESREALKNQRYESERSTQNLMKEIMRSYE